MVVSGLRSQQSQGRSQNSYTSCQSPSQKLLSNAVLLHLEQIVKLKETTFCATVATITKIFASRYGWYYQACHECPNEVTGDKPPYKCTKGHETKTAIFRYKIEVDVVHAGTKCKFVLWDKESEELLEVSAAHMRETMFKVGIFDPLDFPLALDKLLDQELAFKVKWQPDWTNCSVIMLVKDKPVVNQLKPEWVAATTVNSHQLCPL
ncbi:uncharacterized protein LOC131662249 isoform X3 [Vicia villosa]|nr:uncharacterized protein LOC131662249 isoform X3 [Vicia villosa]XP_058787963.1 uncharacterized protein LOC131662249 isoform X3 [Vicia villosa]XP_058787964.1 uncharacterized protein LOC131662249 isoform X3 [Vicia villosa]XP_058787965.1 uncharacterized protein LOC131662249 isoform X3 [Vicia villosa]XP_058787966.1 uncharacterized protein LOC131662249 isoform X3 [Vicia villosa]